MSGLTANAVLVRQSSGRLARALVVTGDSDEARFWADLLGGGAEPPPSFSVERGKKGNLLGALQAYAGLRGTATAATAAGVDQIVMLFGSGTRLSPFTQALRNIKSAFPLPDAERGAAGLSVGEAAIRSTGPWIDCLEQAGFDGVVLRWGDEVLIPSVPLDPHQVGLAGADVVRFGWRTDPNELLANQKEWLQVESATGAVVRDISRQPLDELRRVLDASADVPTDTYVNLGSFAASHDFMALVCDAFGSSVHDDVTSANWDPYFWQALQCEDADDWHELIRFEADHGMTGAADLTRHIPDFLETVHRFRDTFEERHGRRPLISVLDFGEPYWIDAGSHVALARVIDDVFAPGDDGDALRAFLGLPESLATGDSFVVDSTIPPGVDIVNSIVIGSTITDPGSSLAGTIVLGSTLGRLDTTPGSSVVWCRADSLTLDGPGTVAFRLDEPRGELGPGESVTTVLLGDTALRLRYDQGVGQIDSTVFEQRILDNARSFAEAAALVRDVDPVELHREWRVRLGH